MKNLVLLKEHKSTNFKIIIYKNPDHDSETEYDYIITIEYTGNFHIGFRNNIFSVHPIVGVSTKNNNIITTTITKDIQEMNNMLEFLCEQLRNQYGTEGKIISKIIN